MSWRRCMPGHEMASAACSAAFRAASTSGPCPTTVSTRPPAVRQAPCSSRLVPAWNTSAPVFPAASRPSISSPLAGRLRVAGRRQHDPHDCVTRHRQPTVGSNRRCGRAAKSASRRREQERPKRGGEPGQEHLRLGVAEPRVALEEHRTGAGEHQARIERADERGPATRELGEDRAVDRPNELGDGVVGQVGKRAVRAHAAGVRAAVAVGEPLVVAGKRQREGVAAVAQRDQRRFLALEPLLHDHADADCALSGPVVVGKERVERLVRVPGVRADRHALPRRKPVSLDHDAIAPCGERVRVRARGRERFERPAFGHPDAGGTGDLAAERLARSRCGRPPPSVRTSAHRLQAARRRRRPPAAPRGRSPQARPPRAGRARRAQHRRADRSRGRRGPAAPSRSRRCPAQRSPRSHRVRRPASRRARARVRRRRPRGPGRHHEATAHATIPGRFRIGRQARSIVWVRSGPTDTSTIGTRAYSSIAVT